MSAWETASAIRRTSYFAVGADAVMDVVGAEEHMWN